MINKNYLSLYYIFKQPSDYPNNIVVREDRVFPGGQIEQQDSRDVYGLDELEKVRDKMRDAGLFCLKRSPDDVPSLVECWL